MKRIGLIFRFLVLTILLFSLLPMPARAATGPDLALYPVLFRRADAPADPSPDMTSAAQVIMVGDTSLARGVQDATAKYGMDYPLNQVSPWLQAADLAVGNYEGVIAADGVGAERANGYRLRAQPDAAAALARAGFKLLNLANNHTLDWGPDALKATVDNLHAAGVQTVGAGQDEQAAQSPVITTVRDIKIAWLSFTMVPDPDGDRNQQGVWTLSWLDPGAKDDLTAAVKAARTQADVVIVQFHWGIEYAHCPQDWQVQMAQAAINAGASLVAGHHPHVVQTYEVYGGGFIAYSLGNFLFDQTQPDGLALWIRLDKQGVIDVHGLTLTPGIHSDWQQPAQTAANVMTLCRLDTQASTVVTYNVGQYGLSAQGFFPAQQTPQPQNICDTQPADPSSAPDTAREIGQIDMKGDGNTERVVLKDGTLSIFEGDKQVYTSYAGWEVVDASLGDPNQDGRFEVMMLLWKQDDPGDPVTTHPFILGYRGGEYKVIWGGSDTAAWVQALGVADTDGDHLDELVTIERDLDALPCDARYRVVVTKWNGWGFTRQWASDYGRFNSLSFADTGSGASAIIAH